MSPHRLFVTWAALGCACGIRAANTPDFVPEAYAHAVAKPLSWHEARITGDYPGSDIERTSTVSIPDFIAMMGQAGGFENCRSVVADEKGKLALMRGPLLYCLESPDNPEINLVDVQLAAGAAFREKPLELANGATSLAGTGWDKAQQKEVVVTAIPYHLRANRGSALMRIWIPARDNASFRKSSP